MTRLPKPKQWVFSRETQLEAGSTTSMPSIVKASRSGYAPKNISRAHILSPQTAPMPRETANDQIATARAMGALQNE